MINHTLAVRSDFSIGESLLQVDKLVARAKELGYASVALVDIMTVSSMVAFTEKAKKAGIKPIIGCTVRVYDDPTYRKPKKGSGDEGRNNRFFWLKVYAKSEIGIRSILKLLSKGYSADYFYYFARVGLQEILELEDVVVTTGDFFNVFHHPDSETIVATIAGKHQDTFIEVVAINTPLFERLNEHASKVAVAQSLPMIVTRPVHYSTTEDADSLDVLRTIAMNAKVGDGRVPQPYMRDLNFKAPVDLAKDLHEAGVPLAVIKQGLEGNAKLVSLCPYTFAKLPPSLPVLAPNEFAAVGAQCATGWHERFDAPVLGHQPTDFPVYKERLSYELLVLKKMGFSGYFLLVADIVRWSKAQGIIVGPGRGSVGGSLVAYLMGITDVDPIRFDLLFERFINPDRIDLPDADLDFMSTRRHEVIAYITEKYGQDRVAGISNYNALGAASALRDTARVYGLEPGEYACSKQVEKEHGVSLTLAESAEGVPDIAKFATKHPVIFGHALRLEGAMRSLGKHAAGVVVGGEPLINRAVVETREGADVPVINWDKKYVEDWGLIKMDILGLSTLDMLDLGRRYVKDRTGVNVDYLRLPLDDPKVMERFALGETTGVFQFESPGMRRLLKQLAEGGPLTFDDLVAVVALYRPGPLDAGLCDDYIAIKQGAKRPMYDHPNMIPAVSTTHGVIVYQEQVMQIARDVAGMTITEADHLRKAMGKKDKDIMAAQRDKFVSGCMSHSGMTEQAANQFFDKIEVFASYAFNKSHSVEYSIISYWTMWLKTHYPAEFYAANITIVDKEDRLSSLVLDARKHEIEVLPPDINRSSDKIEIYSDKLYAPFQAIRGISENVTKNILKAREALGKPVQSQIDFEAALTVSKLMGKVNVSHRERMAKVGVFAECEGGLPSTDVSRLKDRLEFLPGYTVDVVKATRGVTADKLAMVQIVRLLDDLRTCTGCSLAGNAHPLPRVGKTPKFLMVFDYPDFSAERAGKLFEGDNADLITQALRDAGLDASDGYFTALVKSPKPKGQKLLTNEQINGCKVHLQRELEILKPPIIVAMGSAAARYFAPGLKGGADENLAKTIYDADLDASVVIGLNPARIFFDPSKVEHLHKVCRMVANLIT